MVELDNKFKGSEIDWHRRELHAMHGRGMRQYGFDVAEIDPESYGSGPFFRPIPIKLNEALAIQLTELIAPKASLKKDQACSF
ncbi:hypothetical protein [Methylocystis sp. B8]|uniref:hypothetical protein n=1 Tax=Methylocystis sp. B8 TaxID=544938 RepID=UPI001485B14F|nr:hypothetical protein [Methylocystis sp. B8]